MKKRDNEIMMIDIWEILKRDTDADNPITLEELAVMLRPHWGDGVTLKLLTEDLEAFIAAGYPVKSIEEGNIKCYWSSERELEFYRRRGLKPGSWRKKENLTPESQSSSDQIPLGKD